MVKRAFFPIFLACLLVCPCVAQEMIRVDLGGRVVLEYDATFPEPDGARLKSLTDLWRREHAEVATVAVVYYWITYEQLKTEAHIDDTGGILLGTSRSISFGPAEFAFGERGPLPVNVRRHEVWLWQIQDRVVLHELYHLYVTAIQPLLAQNVSRDDLERHIEQMTLLFMASDTYKSWLVERPWMEGSSG